MGAIKIKGILIKLLTFFGQTSILFLLTFILENS